MPFATALCRISTGSLETLPKPDAIEIALRDARLSVSQLHGVLLSGGGALLPLLGCWWVAAIPGPERSHVNGISERIPACL